jgi:dihydroflavonol-4-reductase
VKAAVTGGSGVVGQALVRHLVGEGHGVVALARSKHASDVLEGLGADTMQGDVLDPRSLVPLVAGCEVVFHVAGVNEMCSRDPGHMDRVNVEGTLNVKRAAQTAHVPRMVHTSSAVTVGEAPGTVATEATAHRGSYLSRYERSKHLSELAFFEEPGELEVVAVNPSSVQGPGRAGGTGRLFIELVNGTLPFVVATTFSIVDIDDCARGHLLAATRGVSGERYLLSGASLDMGAALDLLAAVTGRRPRPRVLPGWVAAVGAGVVEAGSRLVGARPRLCREMVRVLRAGHVYDGTRATRDLGLAYTPVEETLRRSIEWFRGEGLLS